MNPDLFDLPIALWIVGCLGFAAAGLVVYALHSKGDVMAEFYHGPSGFRLEAKDRGSRKTKARSH